MALPLPAFNAVSVIRLIFPQIISDPYFLRLMSRQFDEQSVRLSGCYQTPPTSFTNSVAYGYCGHLIYSSHFMLLVSLNSISHHNISSFSFGL